MVGNAICWLLFRGRATILEFDVERQSLAVIPMPDTHLQGHAVLCRQNSSELGLVILSNPVMQLWARKVTSDAHGAVGWVLRKTVELEKLLSLRPSIVRWLPTLVGYDEDNNQLFVMTASGVFMIQLESLQFRNLFKSSFITVYFPYTSFYTADREIGDDHERGEMSNDSAVRSTKVCLQQIMEQLPELLSPVVDRKHRAALHTSRQSGQVPVLSTRAPARSWRLDQRWTTRLARAGLLPLARMIQATDEDVVAEPAFGQGADPPVERSRRFPFDRSLLSCDPIGPAAAPPGWQEQAGGSSWDYVPGGTAQQRFVDTSVGLSSSTQHTASDDDFDIDALISEPATQIFPDSQAPPPTQETQPTQRVSTREHRPTDRG
ncbi:hypothetical protein ACP4OV_012096 [Aristida adscensionis]